MSRDHIQIILIFRVCSACLPPASCPPCAPSFSCLALLCWSTITPSVFSSFLPASLSSPSKLPPLRPVFQLPHPCCFHALQRQLHARPASPLSLMLFLLFYLCFYTSYKRVKRCHRPPSERHAKSKPRTLLRPFSICRSSRSRARSCW